MIEAAFTGFIAGTLMGMRFRVAILLPAMLVTVAAIVSFGVLSGQEASRTTARLIIVVSALQLGYLSTALIAARSTRKLSFGGPASVHDSR